MKSFGTMIKLFLKSPQILLAYILMAVVANVEFVHLFQAFMGEYRLTGNMGTDGIYYIGDASVICSVFFLFWVFISFEYFRKSKAGYIQENLDCMGARGSMIYFQQLGVLLLALLIIVLNVGAYLVWGFYALSFSSILVEQIVKLLLVDILLMSVASIFCGSILSEVKNRFAGYGLMLALSAIMMWKLLEPIAGGMSDFGNVLYFIRKFICVLPPDMLAAYDALYGISYDGYRIAIIGIWIVAGSIWMLRKLCIRRKKVSIAVTGGCLALIVLLGTVVWNRGSVLLQSESPESAIFEVGDVREEMRNEAADFAIRGYQMELKVRNDLQAECKIELGEGGSQGSQDNSERQDVKRKEYHFTLYYKYRIQKIRDDQNKEMKFRQEGNYVTVETDGEKPVREMTFYYKGGSNLFYSNRHACFLTGIFPYYPKAGFQELFYDGDGKSGLKPVHDPEVSFDIGFDIPGEVISNLEYTGGRYRGTTDSALFMKGYLDYDYFKENRAVYYPMQRYSYETVEAYHSGKVQEELNQLMQYLGGEPMELGQKLVVFIPGSLAFGSTLGDYYYETDSYILTMGTEPAYSILESRMGLDESSDLQQILFFLAPTEDTDAGEYTVWKDISYDEETYTKRDELNDVVIEKMREIGVQEVARQIYARLVSEGYTGDIESDLEFVKKMEKQN